MKLLSEEFSVPSSDPGIDLFIRNKRRHDASAFSGERTVLFVHGATYPASTSFDLVLDGRSWMDVIADRGFDVYLLDLRGYGRSSRPPEMSEPAEQNPPLVRGDVALRDITLAVDFIRKRRGIDKISLIGWSWGTTLVATYSTMNSENVHRLVLYAPLWIRSPDKRVAPPTAPLAAYRQVLQRDARARWLAGVPDHAKDSLIPGSWFDKWVSETWATETNADMIAQKALRAPNGVVQDVLEFYNTGRGYFDPSKITAPTLLAVPEWDNDTPPYMAETLFPLLPDNPLNRLVLLPEGTHTMLMERNRELLFDAVQTFLEGSD
jgi:pimeloyl-ACP methyl ester carboxylesterase